MTEESFKASENTNIEEKTSEYKKVKFSNNVCFLNENPSPNRILNDI